MLGAGAGPVPDGLHLRGGGWNRGGLLLAQAARDHLPTHRRGCGLQPLPCGDCQYPGAVHLGQCRGPPGGYGKGHRHHPEPGGEDPKGRVPGGIDHPGNQAGPGDRRWDRRHDDRPEHHRQRLQGVSPGPGALDRRAHGSAVRDLSHPGLRPMHLHAPHGGGGAEPGHKLAHLLRGGGDLRLRGQLHRQDPPQGGLRGLGQVHRLRHVHGEVSHQGEVRVQHAPGRSQGHLHTLSPGGSQQGDHRPGELPVLPKRSLSDL